MGKKIKECVWIDPRNQLPYKGWITWDNGTIAEIYSDSAKDANGKRLRIIAPLEEVQVLV